MQKLKQFFKDFEDVKATVNLIFEKQKETTDIKDVILMRHLFGSIDLSDVKPIEELKEQERKDFAASIAIVFPKLLRTIKPIIEAQKDAGYTIEGNATFIKGTMNGIYLVLEAFETVERRAFGEHEATRTIRSPRQSS